MSKQERLNRHLFNKLFSEMSSVRKIKNTITEANNIKLSKKMNYLYYSKNTHMWFGFSETEQKFIYFFGIYEGHINNLNSVENSIMIDFDKNNNINETSLGLITEDNTVYLNKDLLETKYPTFNSTDFKDHIIHNFNAGAKVKLTTIELGHVDNDLLDNLNKFIKKTPSPMNSQSTKKSEKDSMSLFLNAIKSGKSYENSLKIADIGNSKVKTWYLKGRKGKEKYIEFYETYKKIMPRNETNSRKMKLIIDSMQSGKTEVEAINIAHVSLSELKTWIKKGKNGEPEYLDFYEEYKILKQKNKPKSETKNNNNELINKYIKLINEGKTNKEAFETLDIPRFKVKNWKKQGQLGNKEYKEFYDTYLMAVNREELKKVNQFTELIKEGKSNEEALKIIKIPKFKTKQWFNKGKNGQKDYVEFYEAYMKQYEKNDEEIIPEENLKSTIKITDNDKKTCEICGRTISAESSETICKKCRKKQRCANIVQDLLASVTPEVPFKKDDLKILGLTDMQVQDYIWTLQEFSLIKKEKNNKFSLISKEKLDEFIEESGVEIKDISNDAVKLTKTCDTCGKTLEISKFPVSDSYPDGYEDNCKSCKKLITTASYLKELLEHVTYEKEFSEDDLKEYYPNPLMLQAKIWSLLDNDLLIKNDETNKYQLADKEKCEEFLSKYFKNISKPQPTSAPISKPPKQEPTKPIQTKKQKQMECVLDAIKNGKTRKEAAEIAGIPLYRITHWYREGRDRIGEDNIYFHKELKKIEKIQLTQLKRNMKIVLKVLKSGGNKSKAAEEASIEESEIDQWIKKGSNGIKPYDTFKKKYDKIYKKSIDFNAEVNIRARRIFLENIREGKTRKEASKTASLKLKLIDSWIIRGNKGEKPYNKFYKEYSEARKIAKSKTDSNEDSIKQEFIKLLKEGYTHGEASRRIENGKYAIKIRKWYAAGKQGVKKHLKFHLDCKKATNSYKIRKNKIFTLISDGFTIKEACEKLNLNPVKIKEEILKGIDGEKPYDEFYQKIIESKTSLIDISKLFKAPNHPHKTQMIDVLDLMLSGESESEALRKANVDETTINYWKTRGKRKFGELYIEFYEIYNQINSGELFNKSRSEIIKNIQVEIDEIEDKDADILKPLPKKIRKALNNLSSDSISGFAWVNKIGNLWTYSRRYKGKSIKITDIDIYELHKKVIKNNLMWGVRDLEKAKRTLQNANRLPNDTETETSNDILSPLPEHLKANFSKGSSTGFAWVSKSGKYFYYTRSTKNIRIKALSLEELHQKVIKNNLEWGVISLTKAKKTLGIKTPQSKPTPIINTDILAPLPEEIENELKKYSRGTSTGFAWVSKTGKKYSYTRVINNKEITIREENIRDLHKKVINKNLTWGVRDLKKAQETLKKNDDKSNSPKIVANTDILSPLSPNVKTKFSKGTSTGFAWVSKSGDNFYYTRANKNIRIKTSTIEELHEKVLNENLEWGVIDLTKAKKILNEKNKKIPSSKPINRNTDILAPLPEEIENELKKYSKGTSTGFAWVSKTGKKYSYTRVINNKEITIREENIRELHKVVISRNLTWGVRDLKKAKQTLNEKVENPKTEREKTPEVVDNNIFAPLPKQFEDSFKSTKINKSGIAWVNKIGYNWIYSRNINKKTVTIKDPNIYRLHQKVINKNLTWGIRDYYKAKISLTSKPLDETEKYILSPISDKIKHFIKTDTGFAFVHQKGDKWEYNNFNNVILTHNNIFGLYEQTLNQNCLWGVTDIEKAKETLKYHERILDY